MALLPEYSTPEGSRKNLIIDLSKGEESFMKRTNSGGTAGLQLESSIQFDESSRCCSRDRQDYLRVGLFE